MFDLIPLLLLIAAVLVVIANTRPPSLFPALAGGLEFDEREPEAEKPWERFLMFKKDSGSAPSPDPRVGEAAEQQAELGRNWLDFAKEQFGAAQERQEGFDELTRQVTEQQLETGDQAREWAERDRSRWEEQFRPVEDQLIEDAQNWDSEERQEQMAGEARAEVLSARDRERDARSREMASMGVDPNSGRYRGQRRQDARDTALMSAGAQTTARNRTRSEGQQMRGNVANMGRNLPTQAMQAEQFGLSADRSAVGTNQAAEGNFRANQGIMGQGYSGAMQGNQNMISGLNQQFDQQMQGYRADQQASAGMWSGLGQAVGTGAGLYMASSEEVKENKQPVTGALQAINGLPVEAWDYKEGVEDGGRHIGPYAEDAQREAGIGDGKRLPVQDMIGLAIKGIQELDDKVDGRAANKSDGTPSPNRKGNKGKRRSPVTIEGEFERRND